MCRITLAALLALLLPKSFLLAQSVYEKLHSADQPWLVSDAAGNATDLLADMQPGQILLALPVDQNYGELPSQLAFFQEVLDVLGEGGTQELSIALVETSGHDLASDSWAGGTNLPLYSGQSATLSPPVDASFGVIATTIQKLPDGSFIEAQRVIYSSDWWNLPLFSLFYQGNPYRTFDGQPSFLTQNAGFPALDESWCDIVGCQIESLDNYALGAGATASNPELWQAYGGLVGTSQDGTIVQDPINPENLALEIKSDTINGDVGFANKHLHAFGEYEIEFDLLRREDKAAFFIGFMGEFGQPATVLGNDLGYTNYFGDLYFSEQGEATTYWFERRGVDLNLSAETWHHIRVGIFPDDGYYIEVNGDVVWSIRTGYGTRKFSAMNFWAPSSADTEFLVDNLSINPVYRKDAADFEGCSNPNACNYNITASSNPDLCVFPVPGQNCGGECVQDSNNDGVCDAVVGCVDPAHPLYEPAATIAEECCTVYEDVNTLYAEQNSAERLLRQSAWSLSRVVVTDSSEVSTYFDSDEYGLEDFQSDDVYSFQSQGNNLLLSQGGGGFVEYDNNYVTQNHLLGYSHEFGVYSDLLWYVSDACWPEENLFPEGSKMIFIRDSTRFYDDVEVDPYGEFERRPSFLGTTDTQGYDCLYTLDKGFAIKTISDTMLVVKSPLADQVPDDFFYSLITFKAEPHGFPFCILGCTNPEACNYESSATYDDGTCHSLCEDGCTDEDALNYSPDAVIDDGSCAYFCGFASLESALTALESYSEPGLLSSGVTQVEVGTNAVAQNAIVVPENFQNSAGTGFPVAWFTPTSISGLPAGLQPSAFPNFSVPGSIIECIVLEGIPTSVGVYNVVVEGDLSVFFGNNEQDFGSFQYTWVIEVTQGTEPILGCTYPDASNFVSYANDDDGSCLFNVVANPCPADFDENGQVGTPDLLEFLAYFGAVCE